MIEYARREPEEATRELEDVKRHFDRIKQQIEEAEQENAREEGFAKGREEERRIQVKSLYANGVAIETIAVSVGLSEPAIRRLLDDE